jgi:sRNA-binding carbon storage regulator CsrA
LPELKCNQVRLGIDAPKNIVVDREEVHHRKQTEYHAPPANEPATRAADAATDTSS